MFDGEISPYGRRGETGLVASDVPGHGESSAMAAAAEMARQQHGVPRSVLRRPIFRGSTAPQRREEVGLQVVERGAGTWVATPAAGRRWHEGGGRNGWLKEGVAVAHGT